MTDLARRRRLRSATAVAAALALGATGCIRGSLPAREYYRLSIPDSVVGPSLPASPGGGAAAVALPVGTLAVAPYVTPGIYADASIAYRIGETEYGAYPSREWALPLGQMLGVLTEGVLNRSPLTRSSAIFNPPSLRSHTYVWRGTVREFEEVDRGRTVSAAVRIDAALVRMADDSVIWTGSARREAPVTNGASMDAVVRALSALAVETVGSLVAEADAAMRRSPPAASARGRD
ncbi:MAG TPA: hypothetical protein VFJ74_01535 [Gemmatimonadaceae bacterium]|nr:hypothetical protein [Gemmatimonadaceae bacterium]